MKMGLPLLLVGTALFLGSPALTAQGSALATESTDADRSVLQEAYAKVNRELRKLEDGLPAKREEIAKLRHRWVVRKGRIPTEEEIKEFGEKLAEGKAKPEENPYFNKSPLTTPAPARAAYYRQLEEIRADEVRLRQLKEELAALELRGDLAGVPREGRR